MEGCSRLLYVAALAAVCAASHAVSAQPTTQAGASVLVFPKVVSDGSWDTTIQVSNGANHPVRARCYYVNGALTFPDQPPSPINPPLWTQTDFVVDLQIQQPTVWVGSRGRPVDPNDPVCSRQLTDCSDAGLDPGNVPPLPDGFRGALTCVELDPSGAPWSGNALRGHATLTHLATGEVVKYPGIGLPGLPANNADGHLCIGGDAGPGCPAGPEYERCAQTWIVVSPSDFDDRPVDGDSSSTSLSIVPCSQNFDVQVPESVTIQFAATNEFEQTFSASTTITCWADVKLSEVNEVFRRDFVGTERMQTRVRPAASSASSFFVVHQTVEEGGFPPWYTAVGGVPHQDGTHARSDVIVLPEGDLQ